MKTPRKKKSNTSEQQAAPLFIKMDTAEKTSTVREYVEDVIREVQPDLPNPAEMAAVIASEIDKLELKTLSVQLVTGFIQNKLAEQHPEKSSEGYLLPKLSDNALTVLRKRYLKKNDAGNPIEEPYQMFRRVAEVIAQADKAYGMENVDEIADRFYEIIAKRYFVPNSPTLMNAGRELGQLSACFVIPVDDSMDSIFEAVKHTALIHKSGGGTGFSFSRLRPTHDPVKSTKGVSSGPISFITVFDAATETIKQGGTRRGANMAILRVDHPDILEFITCKAETEKLNNFNISVGITDAFMKALENKSDYDLINPRTGKKAGSLSAKKVFDMIINMSWTNGEPGMVFIDRLNAANPTPGVGEIEATNPCGEQPLLPYESCNLGSINLAKMVKNKQIDYPLLRSIIKDSVHFLDNVIDQNRYPLPEIREQTLGNRKIGLGLMGWADMLMQMEIPYNSRKAVSLAEQVMDFFREEAFAHSCELAKTRGEFPNIDKSIFAKSKKGKRPRNATVTTIAPTGTISIIAEASSGIEPLFAISFFRRVLDGEKLLEVNPYFELAAKKAGIYSKELMQKIAESGSVQNIDEVPEEMKKIFVCSHDISPKWHVKMQAAFQKHTDNAVSKTINFPAEATVKDVGDAFKLAYTIGCKGLTVYRYGTREQVLNVKGKNKKAKKAQEASLPLTMIIPRPRTKGRLKGTTDLKTIGCGKLYITINEDKFGICELFTSLGRSGGCPSQSEATGRLISLALRSGISLDAITSQLKGIRCHSAIRRNDSSELKKNGERAVSCPAAIAAALEAWYKENPSPGQQDPMTPKPFEEYVDNKKEEKYVAPEASGTPLEREFLESDRCPDCGEPIQHAGGCVVCHSCGFSKCG